MAFYLEVLTGKHSGTRVSLYDGMTIGRKEGDLLLDDDPKVSGLHAKIILDNKNQFILMDEGSANGLVLSGRKVKKIAMLPGVNFRIGGTQFRVIREDERSEISEFSETKIPVPPTPEAPPAPAFVPPGSKAAEPVVFKIIEAAPPPLFKPASLAQKNQIEARELQLKTWKERVQDLLANQPEPPQEELPKLGAFSPALILDFVEGLQAEQKITIGYGPRTAGFGNLDLELLDPKLPEKTFELLPGPGSVEIRDLTGGQMLVNGRPQKSCFLEEGDVISWGYTKIKVRYL